ncbi:hypothetical protein OG738_20045 [Amycolatopsis sp. NBC_01488]|uniref:hypothetical protein n=1 Tax=Amycolatopsis sp. NBC_01488 TaxID=2903563 RepID=UPI002E29DAD5|nr:hypothetical protein [Amycolatopsis sp. NBC_01488]
MTDQPRESAPLGVSLACQMGPRELAAGHADDACLAAQLATVVDQPTAARRAGWTAPRSAAASHAAATRLAHQVAPRSAAVDRPAAARRVGRTAPLGAAAAAAHAVAGRPGRAS